MNKKILIPLLISFTLLLPSQQNVVFHADGGTKVMATATNNTGSASSIPDSQLPYYSYQWAIKNDGRMRGRNEAGSGAVESISGIDINIEPAWDVYMQSAFRRPVTVAVIDTGTDIMHTELQKAAWINTDEIPGDGIDNDQNGYIDDVNGWNFYSGTPQVSEGEESHGTHAAWILPRREPIF